MRLVHLDTLEWVISGQMQSSRGQTTRRNADSTSSSSLPGTLLLYCHVLVLTEKMTAKSASMPFLDVSCR